MNPSDCIDPQMQEWFAALETQPIEDSIEGCAHDPIIGALRRHWLTCPFCHRRFPDIESAINRIAEALRERSKQYLSRIGCAVQNAEQDQSPKNCSAIVQQLLMDAMMVQSSLSFVYGDSESFTCLDNVSEQQPNERQPLSLCAEFILSLEEDVQHSTFEALLADELLTPLANQAEGALLEQAPRDDTAIDLLFVLELRGESFAKALAATAISPHVLLNTIHAAAEHHRCNFVQKYGTRMPVLNEQSAELSRHQSESIETMLFDFRRELHDSADSLKAGQMEILRLIDHNSVRAEHYAPYIKEQLGELLYSRLAESTRRSLHVSEYLYNSILPEPDCFFAPAMALANACEQELLVRLVWPFLQQVLAAGRSNYGSDERPLILQGKEVGTNLTIGVLAWYLKNETELRKFVAALGCNVDEIANNACFVRGIRNDAAHRGMRLPKAAADELRRRVLAPNGILSCLHPAAGTSAKAVPGP